MNAQLYILPKPFLLAATIAIGGSVLLTACQNSSSVKTSQDICTQTDISVNCILQTADSALRDTKDSFEYVSGAGELAVAKASSGQTDAALVLIEQAIAKSDDIVDEKKRTAGLAEIITAISDIKAHPNAMGWLEKIQQKSQNLSPVSQANIAARSITAQAVHGDAQQALSAAINLPQSEDNEANYKAIALRKIANILAKKGEFESARKAINAITMSITYYQSMVRSDVARVAAKADQKQFASQLLSEAEPIARAQDNGYFVGAGLRDIGYSFSVMGELEKAENYFHDALVETSSAPTQNEKARATSRVATRMSDAGLSKKTTLILTDSIAFAEDIPPGFMKGFSYYEIAGAASFSGQFEIAQSLLSKVPDNPLGSTSSMKSAAERDLAWGFARYGQVEKALTIANMIGPSRERIHALSRIVRLLNNPEMAALPRYL